jgi:nicotinate-nucleotide--dimethylbenzimidazole phosphoribosyltransferase
MRRPFDDLAALISDLPGPDEAAGQAVAERVGPAGRLGDLAVWLAAWQGKSAPAARRPIVALYAAAHQGAGEPEGAARKRLDTLAAGEGAISAAARTLGAGVEVFDLAVDKPSADAAERAAMSEKECAATLAFGMEALAKGPDLLVLGDVASGSDRAAGALAAALHQGEAEDWAAGDVVWTERALARAQAEGAAEPLDLLRQLGGRETAALAGAILAARTQKVPVLLDGYPALAAAAVLAALRPDAVDHCQASAAASPAEQRLVAHLGKRPILDLGLERSGGLAGVAALSLVRVAAALAGEG